MLGRLPEGLALEDGLTTVAQQVVARLTHEAAPDRAKKLLTDALLLTGLRVRRDVARRIFRGVRLMQESDTYLMIRDEGKEEASREHILLIGEDRLGPADEATRSQLSSVTDLPRLKRMVLCASKAATWQQILDTP
jgi:hypothetical protein